MPINLKELEKAAIRFESYQDTLVKAKAMPAEVSAEQAVVAEIHRRVFRPAAERLLNFQPAAPRRMRGVMTLPDRGDIPEVLQRDNDLRPMRFLHIAMLAAQSVGRIRISDGPSTEEGDATGFMIAPGLLMTNWHVFKTEDFAAAASVVFNDEDGVDGNPLETKAFRLRPDLLFVNDEALDYAIVETSPLTSSGAPLSQYGYLRLFKQTGKLDPTQRQAANIIQHPSGGPKKIALRDNYVLEIVPDAIDPHKNEVSLFYGTDTLKGSSGSPVCSDQWYVVALHRGGVPETRLIDGKLVVLRRDGTPAAEHDSSDMLRYLTNEGTRVSRIYTSLELKAATDAHAAAALERVGAAAGDPRLGPISFRTAPLLLPLRPAAEGGGVEEIMRRRAVRFDGAPGYSPAFLGPEHLIPLPGMTSEVERELATLKDSDQTELKYANYSIMMNRERRTAFFAAGNIEGSLLWKTQGLGGLRTRPKWSWDPRMKDDFQPDDNIFGNAMQRGHLFKREDAVWGADEEIMNRADDHSFTITNATPMIANFNNVEWGDLEDVVTRESQAGKKISYFAGPVFRSSDRFLNELRRNVPASQRRRGMRVPQSFWKIVAWVDEAGLNAAGFLLDQTDEIAEHGPIVDEINFGAFQKIPIREIEQATGLRFPALAAVDTFGD